LVELNLQPPNILAKLKYKVSFRNPCFARQRAGGHKVPTKGACKFN